MRCGRIAATTRKTLISMDRTRSAAYCHAIKSLRDLQAAELLTSDQMDLFTDALDSYLFADTPEATADADLVFGVAAAELNDMSATGRLPVETTDRLKGEILAVRPQQPSESHLMVGHQP